MPNPNAEPQQPTIEEHLAQFEGFSGHDGVVDEPKKPDEGEKSENEAAETPTGEETPESENENDDAGDEETSEDDEDGDSEESGDETGDEGDKPDEKPKQKPKKSVQKRINEHTRARREAERRAVEAERRAAEVERRIADLERGLTPKLGDATSDTNEAPTPDKYEYGELDAKYIRDLATHEARKAYAAEEAKREQKRQADAAAVKQQELRQKADAVGDAGREKYDDFDDVVLTSPVITQELTQALHDLILGSDVGHDVAYHLASNPKEAHEVFGKSPLEQAAYFGRLEAKFASTSDAQPAPKPVQPTKAPPPVKQARGAGGKFKASPETTDFSVFEGLMRKAE